MIVCSFIPGEVIASAYGTLIAAVISLSIAMVRTRERVVRLEEWVRIYERDLVSDDVDDDDEQRTHGWHERYPTD